MLTEWQPVRRIGAVAFGSHHRAAAAAMDPVVDRRLYYETSPVAESRISLACRQARSAAAKTFFQSAIRYFFFRGLVRQDKIADRNQIRSARFQCGRLLNQRFGCRPSGWKSNQ
jgi:hypothetical protein